MTASTRPPFSKFFTYQELISSQEATRKRLNNTPTGTALTNLAATSFKMEAIRKLLGKPIIVSSGYRSPAVNRAVGGSPTSAHSLGYAVDFFCPQYGSPLKICKAIVASGTKFDQLIEEGTWVHISFDPRMRQSVQTMRNGNYTPGLR